MSSTRSSEALFRHDDLPLPVEIRGIRGAKRLRLRLDEKSGLPVRVEYNPIELRDRVSKVATFADHKPHGDLLLPTSLELTQNGRPAEKWTLEKWEFPEKIDAAVFEAPK